MKQGDVMEDLILTPPVGPPPSLRETAAPVRFLEVELSRSQAGTVILAFRSLPDKADDSLPARQRQSYAWRELVGACLEDDQVPAGWEVEWDACYEDSVKVEGTKELTAAQTRGYRVVDAATGTEWRP